MKTESDVLPIGLCLAMFWALITIIRGLLVPLLALVLMLAGLRPCPPSPARAIPVVAPAMPYALGDLKIAELRRLDRAQDLKALARSALRMICWRPWLVRPPWFRAMHMRPGEADRFDFTSFSG